MSIETPSKKKGYYHRLPEEEDDEDEPIASKPPPKSQQQQQQQQSQQPTPSNRQTPNRRLSDQPVVRHHDFLSGDSPPTITHENQPLTPQKEQQQKQQQQQKLSKQSGGKNEKANDEEDDDDDDEDEDSSEADNDDEDDNDHERDESFSLVNDERSGGGGASQHKKKEIFRSKQQALSPSWNSGDLDENREDKNAMNLNSSTAAAVASLHLGPSMSGSETRSSAGGISVTAPKGTYSTLPDFVNGNDGDDHVVTISAEHRSAASHSKMSSFDMDDWEVDDDDDDAAVRRYHLDFARMQQVPLPAEFSHESLPQRLWHQFLQLRIAARQRRAARLLTMPSESFIYRFRACLLTWCCDATDRGILLVAGLVTAWLLVGYFGNLSSPRYWWMGVSLFGIRVTARRAYERCISNQHKRRRRRDTATVNEAMELANAASSTTRTSSCVGIPTNITNSTTTDASMSLSLSTSWRRQQLQKQQQPSSQQEHEEGLHESSSNRLEREGIILQPVV